MATVLAPNGAQSHVISNLDTYTIAVTITGVHLVQVQMTDLNLPTGIQIQIKQNSTVIATSSTPASQQAIVNLSANINAISGDTISVIISSSLASDSGPNQVKGIINVHVGSNN